MAKSRKMTYWDWPNPGRWLPEEGQIPEDNLPRMAKSRKMTNRDCHKTSLLYDKLEPQKRIWWTQQPKAIFRGRAIPACHKPELIGIFKLTFRGLRNASKSLWLVKVIPGILKPHLMVLSLLCSSREIVTLTFLNKLSGPPVYYIGKNEPGLDPPVQMAGQYLWSF
jgi:hypothetical protein